MAWHNKPESLAHQNGSECLPKAIQGGLVESTDGIRALLPVLGHFDRLTLGQNLEEDEMVRDLWELG